jgi:hypothetical protein
MATDAIKVPDMPAALESNTRRAARAIKSTVRDALETMREVADIINRYRAGESAIISQLESSNTEQAAEWRRAVKTATERDAEADRAYQEAIKEPALLRRGSAGRTVARRSDSAIGGRARRGSAGLDCEREADSGCAAQCQESTQP